MPRRRTMRAPSGSTAREQIMNAQALWVEARSVLAGEPDGSALRASMEADTVELADQYIALCAAVGVCRVTNCYRPVNKNGRRCRSHAPFYGK